MFSLGNFDWKNALGGGAFMRDLGRAQGGVLENLVSGLPGSAMSNGEQKRDLLSLSRSLQFFQQSGLDLERSYVSEESQQLDFSFSFQDEHVRNLTTGGFLDARSQTLKVDFSFQSSLKTVDPVTGLEREETFQFEFHLEAKALQVQEGQGEVKKEDILDFAHKILKKISKLRAEGKEIDGLVLEKQDLKDLGAVEGGKLLRQIGHLIDLMKSIDRLSAKTGKHEFLKPEREKTHVFEGMQYEESTLNFSLSVNRSDTIISSDDTKSSDEPSGGALDPAAVEVAESATV